MGQTTQKHKTKLPDELTAYLAPLQRFPVLTNRTDFDRLFAKYRRPKNQRERKEARDQLVYGNMRLVVKIAFHYVGRGVSIPDLCQEGAIGLMRALQRFDPSLGFRFGTYATWWIHQAIDRAVEDTSEKEPFRLPVHLREKVRAIARAALSFFGQKGCWPNDRELWQTLRRFKTKVVREMSQKEMRRCRSILFYRYHPLHAAIGDNSRTFEEVIADPRADVEREADIALMKERCLEALGNDKHFTPREATIVSQRLGLEGGRRRTLDELGEQFNVSKEWIRVLQKRATRRLSAKVRARPKQKETTDSADSSI